ncbi:PREDICTED: uncharacterized protein LOC106338690 [Brassica oleracea var. oleracea]|uniref:SWIM-type domain-containing protein n=2 Tax=Brassica oleracea var. oleracea TaxID=109376 RepID=A0A0D3BYM3_BRAOL|nr:PREDICTED: uncharacterized protein LOC106338690 [Brassica oleracea var. oleracea]
MSADVVDMYGQRVWYKFPYEDLLSLKVLFDGGLNFQKMCDATQYVKTVEIYLEHQYVNNEAEESESALQDAQSEAHDGETSPHDGADSGIERDEARDNSEPDPRDERVEEIVSEFVDEEKYNEAHRDTPPCSDDEEGDIESGYERWRRGSGELKIMQVFESITEFKEAVLEYALKGGWNVKYTRWGDQISEAKCAVVGEVPCTWRIYCSYEKSVQQYMVKSFQEEHTCTKDGYCKLLTDHVIAKLLINEIRHDNALMPRFIQEIIEDRYNLTVTHDIARKARKRALEMISDEFDEQFARIKDYKEKILETNPGSTCDVVTIIRDDGVEIFDKFYVCFKALKTIWRAYCRPITGIDGCFMKSTSKGQLLAAVGRDTNNQIYPVAWGIVQVEDTDNWKWFIERVKYDLNLQSGQGFTLISDKQKGLIKAVDEELPHIEHRMCARHVYGNVKKLHPNKPKFKKLYWAVANSFNEGDYNAALKELKAFDSQIYDDLMVRDPKTCTRAFFSTTSTSEDGLNNFSESYNSGLKKARSLPLVEMLETMRRQTMVRIEVRKKKLLKYRKKYSEKVANTIAEEEEKRKWCKKRTPGPNGVSEVQENNISYTVNMDKRTCSCRRWDLTGIPCRHALKVIKDKKLNSEDFVAECYLTTLWKKQYSDSITPVEGMKFWKDAPGSHIEPPPRPKEKGRKKNPQKRKKSIHESPTKGKKVSGHFKKIHCYRCGTEGHNSLYCDRPGAPNKPRKIYPRKKKQPSQGETMSVDHGEAPGPSQPTQTSN